MFDMCNDSCMCLCVCAVCVRVRVRVRVLCVLCAMCCMVALSKTTWKQFGADMVQDPQ